MIISVSFLPLCFLLESHWAYLLVSFQTSRFGGGVCALRVFSYYSTRSTRVPSRCPWGLRKDKQARSAANMLSLLPHTILQVTTLEGNKVASKHMRNGTAAVVQKLNEAWFRGAKKSPLLSPRADSKSRRERPYNRNSATYVLKKHDTHT